MPGLYLITPRQFDADRFASDLEAALAGGGVDCVLIAGDFDSDQARQAAAERLVPVIQAHGAAALLADDSRAAGRSRADGLHVTDGAEAQRIAIDALKPKGIVGVGNLKTRHEAMDAAERDIDYVFFGLIDRPDGPETHVKSIELAEWWVPLFECPCVVLAGASRDAVRMAVATGAEFVAVRDAVWTHAGGPRGAMDEIRALLGTEREAG